MKKAPTVAVIYRQVTPPDIYETKYCHEFCLRYLQGFCAPYPLRILEGEQFYDARRVLSGSPEDILILVEDPELLLPPGAFTILPETLANGPWAALSPVYNEADHPQLVQTPPYLYHNVRNLVEVAERLLADRGPAPRPVTGDGPWPCLALRREALAARSHAADLRRIFASWAREGRLAACRGVYAHRFHSYYCAGREDLIRLLPDGARRILDVGCARGHLGKALKSQRACHITGVEMNPTMAREAARYYDTVHCAPIESVTFDEPFDAVICGDIIEHLVDPRAVLERLASALAPGGCLVGSTPNAGHWSVVMDLVAGRFEMIPVGLLCITHLRFFTETDLRQLLESAGFCVDSLERDCPPPTPRAERLIETLVSSGFGDEASLRTAEFRFRVLPRR